MQLLTLRQIGSYFDPTRHLTIQHRYAFLIAMNVAQRSLLPKEMKLVLPFVIGLYILLDNLRWY